MIRLPPRSTRMTHSFPPRRSSDLPMRLDRSGFCVSLAIDNTHFERSAQGLDQNVGDLGFHRDLWAWPRHLAQRGKDRLRIGFGPPRITWREASSEERREGKSVSVRVDIGGGRSIKKKKTTR